MNIFTIYFAMQKKFGPNVVPISIARWNPKFFEGLNYQKLAPTASILTQWKEGPQNDGSEAIYKYRFANEVLNNLNPVEIFNELENLSKGKDIVLLCFERTGDFCHRHLVADWFCKAGIHVEELKF